MTEEELERLIWNGESEAVEFKTSLAQLGDGLRSLCGMVNTDRARGCLLFGVTPEGEVRGVEPGNIDKAQRSIAQSAEKFEPRLNPTIEACKVGGKTLLLVGGERRRAVPHHDFDGRTFIREGTRTRRLTREEKDALARHRDRDLHPGPWKCERCGAMFGMKLDVGAGLGVRRSYVCSCGGELWPAT
jgi:predicted HTH transcriptional regulator